ncbi:MAG: GH92 family glycosyl hydrolase [Bacteroidetes bacterium]|nr:GH92 family glycosyl hydrolase [Bacteroidota bacterium]
MKRIILSLATILILAHAFGQLHLTKYVNPFIGTIFEGNCYPGATLPFGMVQLSPDNGLTEKDKYEGYCSGYSYTKNMIKGFSHTHLSGTGRPALGDISVLPMLGQAPTDKDIRSDISHREESASPGYYSVMLKSFGIRAELTTTQRCGFHRYTFPESKKAMIRLDLGYGAGDEVTTDCYIKKINATTFVGYRISNSSFSKDRHIYFAAQISKPVSDVVLFSDSRVMKPGAEAIGRDVKACLVFSTKKGEQVLLKVALSTANVEGALAGLQEVKDWDFSAVKQSAEHIWERELEKIKITSTDENFKTVFYTALYHTCLAPIRIDDALGNYRGIDKQKIIHGKNIYTINGFWDTFRAENPLLTITQAERIPDIINSLLSFYRQYGLLPVWDLYVSETNTMKGYHAVAVIADAMLKGFKGFDYEEAFEAMKKSAAQNIRATDWYRKLGFIPFEKEDASVTTTLEYAFDDWCIAQVAKRLGKENDYKIFMERSGYWKNLFDPATLFIRPKDSSGKWITPFSPFDESIGNTRAYAEGNAWQFTWYVPQDIPGLVQLFGSGERFAEKLDSLYILRPPDSTANIYKYDGYIGLLWHGNEPCHHIPYLYNYVGMPWKTAEKVKQVSAFYRNDPRGLVGNDDCGQTSAWYVFSAIGFYPVNPASGEYVIGTPQSDKAELSLIDGKQFVVTAKGLSKENIYVQKAMLNGKAYTKSYIKHADIMKGGELMLYMGDKPSATWGTKNEDHPH